jgi:Tol biopolymer transport system component
MSLEERGRRAAEDLETTLDDADRAIHGDPLGRFHRFRRRRHRNQRLAAGAVAAAIVLLAATAALYALRSRAVPATPAPLTGRILFGEFHPSTQLATWYTIGADGTGLRPLGVETSCADWFPDGSRILISNDAAGRPLRPATIATDGSELRPLDAAGDTSLNLGCGDVSPDGERLVLEGFSETNPSRNGIFTVRVADGGGLVRLTHGLDGYPRFAPDGSRILFLRTRPGVQPEGAGALFVVRADGSDPTRITPWGEAFLDQAWSPDGQWIVFQRPYGELELVRPDGSDLHPIPVDLPPGAGARQPSWSADGSAIVFIVMQDGNSTLWTVRPDGSGLRRVPHTPGDHDGLPKWRP